MGHTGLQLHSIEIVRGNSTVPIDHRLVFEAWFRNHGHGICQCCECSILHILSSESEMRISVDGEEWWLCWIVRGYADRSRAGSGDSELLSRHETLLKSRFSKLGMKGALSVLLHRPYDEEASYAELGHGQRGLVCAAVILQESSVFNSTLDVLSDEEHVLCDLLNGVRGSTFMKVAAFGSLAKSRACFERGFQVDSRV